MKKLFILTAVFSAMFLMMSCGGSSSGGGDGYTQDGGKVCTEYGNGGECKGHDVRACVEGDDWWYEVEGTGKKFECKADGDCTQAAVDLNNYCYDTNIDYEEEDGTTCITTEEPDYCGGKPVKRCSKDDGSYWYEVDGKKYDCSNPDSAECTQTMMDLAEYCSKAEEEKENGESTFATDPEAYLPASYADKTLDAWYMLKDEDDDRIKIEAIFLFNDNTLVKTSSKVYSVEDGREPSYEIDAEGTFTITSGDYDNGAAHVKAGEMEFDVTISDGILSAMDAEFTKQDNADAPEPK